MKTGRLVDEIHSEGTVSHISFYLGHITQFMKHRKLNCKKCKKKNPVF